MMPPGRSCPSGSAAWKYLVFETHWGSDADHVLEDLPAFLGRVQIIPGMRNFEYLRHLLLAAGSEKFEDEDGTWRYLKITLRPNNPEVEPIPDHSVAAVLSGIPGARELIGSGRSECVLAKFRWSFPSGRAILAVAGESNFLSIDLYLWLLRGGWRQPKAGQGRGDFHDPCGLWGWLQKPEIAQVARNHIGPRDFLVTAELKKFPEIAGPGVLQPIFDLDGNCTGFHLHDDVDFLVSLAAPVAQSRSLALKVDQGVFEEGRLRGSPQQYRVLQKALALEQYAGGNRRIGQMDLGPAAQDLLAVPIRH